MNSDESPTQEPQAQPAAPSGDGEVDLPVNETEYQLLSQTRDLWIDENELPAQLPPETDPPLGEEDAEIAQFVDEAGAIAQIPPNTDDGESESPIAQIDPPTDSQPTATAETVTHIPENVTEQLAERVKELQQQEQALTEKIAALEADKANAIEALGQAQASIGRLVQDGLIQLDQRKQALQIEVEKLERRRDRIQKEMRTTFAGVSQDLAIRVQGFKDYLVGSLQDLAATAELLDLTPPVQETPKQSPAEESQSSAPVNPRFAEQGFQEQAKQIRRTLDQYRTLPDYYGPPWQLRRTFEPIHAERVSNWFFTQGGRGALRTMGSRLQNILITSTIISVLRSVYGGRVRTLVLANSPERLGEWRRGLQDCLGITRNDFGPERGIIMFESAEALAQKADRLVKDGKLPLIVIDETEDLISLSLLQFPLWLAFASDPQTLTTAKDF
jgi:chaperonin cofactor prefoldin